jgi:hypothetical protein
MKCINKFKEIFFMGTAICFSSFLVTNVAICLAVVTIKIVKLWYGVIK